jgi:hypothetical protein
MATRPTENVVAYQAITRIDQRRNGISENYSSAAFWNTVAPSRRKQWVFYSVIALGNYSLPRVYCWDVEEKQDLCWRIVFRTQVIRQ